VCSSDLIVTVNGDAVVQTVTITGGSGFRGNVGTVNLTATARSGLGNTIVTPITWTSNNAGIATVDASGVVTFAGGTGSLTITGTATGAGAGGSNVAGTTAFEVATTLINGVIVTVPDFGAATGVTYTFSADRVGAASFVINQVGGTGDADLYVFNPGVTNWVTDNNGGSGWVCRPYISGGTETCNIAAAAAGWYRIRSWAWGPAGGVSGLQISVTHP
jgi:serine protease